MPKNNPLRGHYMLVGTDLVRAGVRNMDGVGVSFVAEFGGNVIDSLDPATERWVTSRAVSSACAKAGIAYNMAQIPAKDIMPFLLADPKAKVRTTEDAIVHIAGGETPENRAYAQDQVAALVVTYAMAATKAA